MNTKILTLLGCSGSLAAALLVPHPVQAIPKKIQTEIAPRSTEAVTSTSSNEEFPQTSNISEAVVKMYAQAKFGCLCTDCTKLSRQMLQQGSSSPNSPIPPGF
ncbi:hypothetical protein [Brasilonema sp. UFV-L1]|uniref:hypothetical protein n=1 Tax=Brasilonema sp. UFV-L1 TaxID=2234130 RepID=UPI00145CC2C6|nr:hypothetical protein [Brasilonema sp. UFV-L1]NMG08200.1 hypothetical protein [Brasilonema sp. UFV-L1]